MLHIYIGDGKGKTSAAVGLGIRAAGHLMNVHMVQFLKTRPTGEYNFCENVPNFTIRRFESPHEFLWNMDESGVNKLKSEMASALEYIKDIMCSDSCNVLILDEILDAIECKLIKHDEVLSLLKSAKTEIEIVLTGHHASPELIELANYVSDIKCAKHPYQNGITARKGIEY